MAPRRILSLIASAMALMLLAAASLGDAAATAPRQRELDATVRYLQRAQNADGGFGARAGAQSSPEMTAWASLALAAAGVNPLDQARRGGGVDAIAYLRRSGTRLALTTDFARTALAARAAGASPRAFGGRDLAAAIVGRQLADGSFPHERGGTVGGVNDTTFAILALVGLEPAAVARAAGWLGGVQRDDGAFPIAPGGPANPDVTASAVQALRAARRGGSAIERRALNYLRSVQNADGGLSGNGRAQSDAAATAWTLQALWAAGIDPAGWRSPAGRTPLDFLASMQQADGSVRYSAAQDLSRLWMTAYAAPALAGRPLPIARVARRRPTRRAAADDGVETGGGGRGAPLYTRPSQAARESAPPEPRTGPDRTAAERSSPGRATAPGGPERASEALRERARRAERRGDRERAPSPASLVDGLLLGDDRPAAAGQRANTRLRTGRRDDADGDAWTLAAAVLLGLGALIGGAAELRAAPRLPAGGTS